MPIGFFLIAAAKAAASAAASGAVSMGAGYIARQAIKAAGG